jgi:hypothetical protein
MAFLRSQGMSPRRLAQCTRSTRLWHDLGEYGEIAEVTIEDFSEEFGVDLGEFEFLKYFPAEYVGDNHLVGVLARLVPFLEYFIRMRGKYAPLTLGMLDDAILSKKLV